MSRLPDQLTSDRRSARSRPVRTLALASALAVTGLAALGLDASATSEEDLDTQIRTVTVSADDAVSLVLAEPVLPASLSEALDARAQLVATEPPPPPPAPEPEPTPEPAATSGAVDVSVWDRLAQCESGGNWSINTGNGFYGGLQFTIDSWRWVGGSGYPHEASKAEQIARAEILLGRQGWEAWPACSSKLGLR
jgi:hypothetical protein